MGRVSEGIAAFVRARLDEDERLADGLLFACKLLDKVPDFFACGGPAAEAYWEHYNPRRALREIKAKRRVLDRHRPFGAGSRIWPEGCGGCGTTGDCDDPVTWEMKDCPELRDLAAVWDDHPDYRPEWSPATD